jgi:hypothetical protein
MEQPITPTTEARHPPGTCLGGAPRGGPRASQHQTRREGAFTITADAAYLGWPRPAALRERHGSPPVHGRMATPLALGGTKARSQASPGKVTTQGKGRPRCSQRGGGVVVAGLMRKAARRRCSRRRPALVRLLCCRGQLLLRPAPRVPDDPQQRRASGDAAPNLPRLASPPPTPPLLRRCTHENGENPQAGWWEAISNPGLSYRVSVKAV